MSEIRKPRQMSRRKAPPKPKREPREGDSEAYLALLRQCPCAAHAKDHSGRIAAHHCTHLSSRGMSMRVEDRYAIPLCHRHHEILHIRGTREHSVILLGWGIDGQALADELWRIYREEDEPLEKMRDCTINHQPKE